MAFLNNSNGNNHSLIYFLLAIIGVLLIVVVMSIYSQNSSLEELITDFSDQTERTHSDITKRLAELQQRG